MRCARRTLGVVFSNLLVRRRFGEKVAGRRSRFVELPRRSIVLCVHGQGMSCARSCLENGGERVVCEDIGENTSAHVGFLLMEILFAY